VLLDGMRTVVAYLEPKMEKKAGSQQKGTIVLATVKGDVHDIGKNLVDIIHSFEYGYRVINLGIKQPGDTIIKAAQERRGDADDAFGGLHIMEDLVSPNRKKQARLEEGRTVKEYAKAVAIDGESGPNIPAPPFWGVRVKKDFDLRELFPYVNDTALFKNQ
jgi:cobalamin-dependent methionine synthase I